MDKNKVIEKINIARALLDECLVELGQNEVELPKKDNLIPKTNQEKTKTLREIVRGKRFRNGQEQIAVIVGYHEKERDQLVHKDKIKGEWINAKMASKYNPNFLKRAKDDLVRIHPNGTCDLTQTGDEFYDNFLKNESATSTSE